MHQYKIDKITNNLDTRIDFVENEDGKIELLTDRISSSELTKLNIYIVKK